MYTVVGIQFSTAGKIHRFSANNLDLNRRDQVIVKLDRGLGWGTVVEDPKALDGNAPKDFPYVVRRAESRDYALANERKKEDERAFILCKEKITQFGLEMKLAKVEILHSGNKAIFFFTSEQRVDFRSLVRDLAHELRMRIEMRQIGVRDEAKLKGGIGPCGLALCCGSFLRDFLPVSIKMAKDQNLTLNPEKVSGICGRLMCCLTYEASHYKSELKGMPKMGKKVKTPDGEGRVEEINIFRRIIRVGFGMRNPPKEYQLDRFKAWLFDDEPYTEEETSKQENLVPMSRGSRMNRGVRPDEDVGEASMAQLDRLVEESIKEKKRKQAEGERGRGNRRGSGSKNSPRHSRGRPPRKRRPTTPSGAAKPSDGKPDGAKTDAAGGPAQSSEKSSKRRRGGRGRVRSKRSGQGQSLASRAKSQTQQEQKKPQSESSGEGKPTGGDKKPDQRSATSPNPGGGGNKRRRSRPRNRRGPRNRGGGGGDKGGGGGQTTSGPKQ